MKTLYPFQEVGAAWLSVNPRGLLWDEPGLGKTVQAVAALDPNDTVLVVCPSAVKGVWAREARDAGWESVVLQGRTPVDRVGLARSRMVIVNPECLPNPGVLPYFLGRPDRPTVIVDEAHMYKNPKAARTENVRSWMWSALDCGGSAWQLTGTPILNRPLDLWHVLSNARLEKVVFGSWNQFLRLFNARQNRWGGFDWGLPHPSVPHLLSRVALRRTRAEVLPDLPTKTYERVDVQITYAAERAVNEAAGGLASKSFDETFELLQDPILSEHVSTVRRALAEAKLPALHDLLDVLEQEGPVVVFSDHVAPAFSAATRKGWVCVTGNTPSSERTAYEEAFQRGELAGIAGTVGAMGVGLTLTAAHRAVFVDRSFTPALNTQAEDRVCRIGQDRGVVITDLVSNHKVDQALYKLLRAKQTIADAALTPADEAQLREFSEVLHAFQEEAFEAPARPLLSDVPRKKRGKKWPTF